MVTAPVSSRTPGGAEELGVVYARVEMAPTNISNGLLALSGLQRGRQSPITVPPELNTVPMTTLNRKLQYRALKYQLELYNLVLFTVDGRMPIVDQQGYIIQAFEHDAVVTVQALPKPGMILSIHERFIQSLIVNDSLS